MYYIYHIPGVKIGCTVNIKNRMTEQGFSEWEILEQHEDGWLAGDRELELQKQYGYRVDNCHYMISLQNRPKGFKDPSAAGKKGAWVLELYRESNALKLKERMANRTPEEIQAHNKKVSDARMSKGTHPSQRVGTCDKCGRAIIGAGPLGRHKKNCNV